MSSSHAHGTAVRIRLGAAMLGGVALVSMAAVAVPALEGTPVDSPPSASGNGVMTLAPTVMPSIPQTTLPIEFAKPTVTATYSGKH